MRAVVFQTFGGPASIDVVAEPAIPSGGALIKVMATGVCRSDWHAWTGHDPRITLPHVPGHEFAGVVAAVGDEVLAWEVGDRVTVPFACGCGTCGSCAVGATNLCEREYQPGFSGWGSFAEHVAVPWADTNLVRLPDELDFVAAAGLGCRFVTAYWGLVDKAELRPGEWLAIHGAGGVGLSALLIGVALGARVAVVDVDESKLDRASDLGAHVVVDASAEDAVNAIRSVTGGGAQVSVDALGATETVHNSIRCLARRGRHIQIGLVIGEGRLLPIPMTRVISMELELHGTHGMPAHAYRNVFDLIGGSQIPLDRLVGNVIGLEEAPAALAAMATFSGVGTTVIDLTR